MSAREHNGTDAAQVCVRAIRSAWHREAAALRAGSRIRQQSTRDESGKDARSLHCLCEGWVCSQHLLCPAVVLALLLLGTVA